SGLLTSSDWNTFNNKASFAYLFPAGATSSPLMLLASTTIGNGTQGGGLTISGGATTTGNAYFGGNVGIGTSSPVANLTLVNSLAGADLGNYLPLTMQNTDATGYTGFSILDSDNSVLGYFGAGNKGSNDSDVFFLQNNLGPLELVGKSVDLLGKLDYYTVPPAGETYIDADTLVLQGVSSGNVGIGNTSPSYELDVAGFINTDQYSGYKQAGNTVLYASTTNNSLAIGAPEASAWMAANANPWYDTAIGSGALATTPTNASAQYNTAEGYNALYSNTTGSYNSAQGVSALYSNTTGSYNSAQGAYALYSNTTGYNNSAQGVSALYSNTTGYNNSAQGAYALYSNTTGYNNSAQGVSALYSNTTGSYNSGLGYQAGYGDGSNADNQSVIDNYMTFIGMYASRDASVASTTALSKSIAIGYNAKVGGSNMLVLGGTGADAVNVGIGSSTPWGTLSLSLGTANPSFVVGHTGSTTAALFVAGTNQNGFVGIGTTTNIIATSSLLVVGNSNIHGGKNIAVFSNAGGAAYVSNLGFTVTSDQRLKKNISSLNPVLPQVLQLNPVTYNLNSEPNGTPLHTGFIAQQVQPIFPDLVSADDQGMLSLNYAGLTPYLVSALKQQEGAVDVTQALTGTSTLKSYYQGTSISAITVDTAGNVGVGTATPNAKLSVSGNIFATSYETTNIAGSSFTFGATTTASQIPAAVLTAAGTVDLYKLSTYNLAGVQALASEINATEIRLISLEDRVTKLEDGSITSASGSPITLSSSTLASALNSVGILVQNGVAQFNTLVFRQLVASKDADGTSSAGTVTILAGNTVAQVTNSMVKPTTKIFVTFNSQLTGTWWVSNKADGSFRVMLSVPQSSDVSFDYFLVQTEGQIATSSPLTNGQPSSGNQSSGNSGSPSIILIGDNPMHVDVGTAFIDPGVTVTDSIDGTDPVTTYINGIQQAVSSTTIDTSSPTTYIITYAATDSAGNSTTHMRSVIVGNPDGTVSTGSGTTTTGGNQTSSDTTPPTVTLIGAAAMQLNVGDTFVDPGSTASDTVDGNLTSKIVETGSVDTATAGTYTLSYSATDAAGNTGSVSRLVTVVGQ
ncbi:MAG: immunoglobulin-like domain-containing protein, partial [Minisyncoccia bacterium]